MTGEDPTATAGTRPAVLGLAARPGQRRAVRLTAVALGLLALALGVRDATRDEPATTGDVRQEAPEPGSPAEGAPADEDGRGPAATPGGQGGGG